MKNYINSNKFHHRMRYGGIRMHPWLHSGRNPDEKYYDFKKNPELVSEVLEGCTPWAKYDAIQLFYQLIRWLNGEDSRFESNDSRFYGPHDNTQADEWPKKMECSGSLMFFFRSLTLNVSPDSEQWHNLNPAVPILRPNEKVEGLVNASNYYLTQMKPDLEWGCVVISVMPTLYTELPGEHKDQLGHEVGFEFWAFGDDKEDTMNNFREVVSAMFDGLKKISEDIRQSAG